METQQPQFNGRTKEKHIDFLKECYWNSYRRKGGDTTGRADGRAMILRELRELEYEFNPTQPVIS